ncbi:MAG: ATP-binding protein [Burkholderiales bacterium]|nr:ATP-binding protein [Burkholderiales bacterium]
MKSDRLGLTMIGATLGVIALILLAVFVQQSRQHERQLQAQGNSLARALASVPVKELAPSPERPGMLRTLVGLQRRADLAYALWQSPQGGALAEVSAPGLTAPQAPLPSEPAHWFGQRELRLPDDNTRILEFHAPVMDQGALAGFVRLGYRAEGWGMDASALSFQAVLALPIFLLAPLFFVLIRREMRPLAQLGQRMHDVSARLGEGLGDEVLAPRVQGAQLDDFVRRLGEFLQRTEGRMRELESERMDTVASQRLISYKRNRVEAVLHTLPEGVLVLDGQCTPTFANAKLEPLLGATPEQIVGQPPPHWCRQPEVLAFLLRQQGLQGDALLRPASADVSVNGAVPRHLQLVSYPLFSPTDTAQLFGTLVVVRDVTQERLARDAGAEFVASVSHELKTPLNTLKAYSELLMDAGGDEAVRVEAVNVIHAEVDRMAGLINNLLNISKLETGAIALAAARVNVHDLLAGAFEAQRQNAVGKGLKFRINVPVNLGLAALDKDLMRIAVNNLLSNAIKYNRDGGEVVLSAQETEDEHLEIRVRDSGIGISPAQAARVFDKYFRADDPEASSRSGHGLGLYLVRQIVELHHGSVTLQSEPGQGSEFCIRLKKLPALYEEAIAA